jgi:hypothetical protein
MEKKGSSTPDSWSAPEKSAYMRDCARRRQAAKYTRQYPDLAFEVWRLKFGVSSFLLSLRPAEERQTSNFKR